MTAQSSIIRAVGYVLNRVLSIFPVWTITPTDGVPLLIRAPIPIFRPDSIVYSIQSIINGLRVKRSDAK